MLLVSEGEKDYMLSMFLDMAPKKNKPWQCTHQNPKFTLFCLIPLNFDKQ